MVYPLVEGHTISENTFASTSAIKEFETVKKLIHLTGALLQLGVKHPFLIQLTGQISSTRASFLREFAGLITFCVECLTYT